MKTPSFSVVFVLLSTLAIPAQTDSSRRLLSIQTTETGPHHRVLRSVTVQTDNNGQAIYQTNNFTELQTGMNVQQPDGTWTEASEEIEVTADGAIGRKGRHKVIFAANCNTATAIDMLTADGKRLQSHVIGLGYYDSASGKSVLFAALKDSPGQVLPPNRVIYLDAFTDGLRAHLRYTYTKAGLEQDVVFRSQPPLPEVYDMNPETTRMQIFTEFINPPTPLKTISVVNELPDEMLDFGDMRMEQGKAFSVFEAAQDQRAVAVGKTWTRVLNRDFLVEQIPFRLIESQLKALPLVAASAVRTNGSADSILHQASFEPRLPAARLASKESQVMQIAKCDPIGSPAFVWDWVALSSTPNKTLQGNMTYYVSGYVVLSGTAQIEGGAVLKFTNTTTAAINIAGTLVCPTGTYRPGVCTAKDDNSIGDWIPGSTGTPIGKYGNGLVFWSSGAALQNLRFSHANSAVTLSYMEGQISMTNIQFINCTYPIDSSSEDLNTIIVNNCLLSSATYGIKGGRDLVVIGQHLTADNLGTLVWSQNQGDSYAYLTNCVLASVTSLGHAFTLMGDYNGFYNSPTFGTHPVLANPPGVSPFTTYGAASHYLRADSSFHAAGTTLVPSSLLDSLKKKTTYQPTIRNGIITQPETLSPQNRYISGLPDLGYYYDAIDYAMTSFTVQQTSLTVSPGTVIASFGSPGIHFDAQAEFHVKGLPTDRVRFCDSRMVQEGAGGSPSTLFCCDSSRTVKLRFADFDVSIGGQSTTPLNTGSLEVSDCAFRCPWATFTGGYILFRNNLFESTDLYIFSPPAFFFQNNLVKGGGFGVQTSDEQQGEIKDNVFHGCTLRSESGTVAQPHHHNRLVNTSVLHPAGWWVNSATDATLPSLDYVSGLLGPYYLPENSPLIDNGSQTAAATGLYHYTTRTTQQKEAASNVDIGLHYVALNQYGNPFDTDSVGLPDYQEVFGGYITNVSQMQYQEAEPTIAVNPKLNASGHHDIYVFSVRPGANSYFGAPIGLMKALSTDGGRTWSSEIFATGPEPTPPGTPVNPPNLPKCDGADPCAVYDSHGNLFLSYQTGFGYSPPPERVVVAVLPAGTTTWVQRDEGALVGGSGGVDQPWLAVGPAPAGSPYPETLWVCYYDSGHIKVTGAFVRFANNVWEVGSFAPAQLLLKPSGKVFRHPRIAIGPAGQVMCVYQDDVPHDLPNGPYGHISYRFNHNGLLNGTDFYHPEIGSTDFSTSASVTQLKTYLWNKRDTVDTFGNHGPPYFHPALIRGVCNKPEVAWDRTRNRIYVAYADMQSGSTLPNTDVYVKYTVYNSQGMNWSAANSGLPIESQDGGTAQFMPDIAVDQASGNVAVGWYDGRSDTVSPYEKVQYYAAVSRDLGASFGQDFALTPGLSDSNLLNWGVPSNLRYDLLDYTGVAYLDGVLYAVWADNANSPVSNFFLGTDYLDIYVGFGTPPFP